MRIVFFGTPELAVPTLERLIASRFDVVAVVSQPDRGRGRGRQRSPSPVAKRAIEEGIPLLRPEHVGDPEVETALRALEPDIGVVVAFGQFIPKPIRELPSCGYLINAHASLLPAYRGAAPIARAIWNGEKRTGISVMRVDREMDAGPVAMVRDTRIGESEDTGELSARLATLAADAIEAALEAFDAGGLEFVDQDASRATLAPKLERGDSRLDFGMPARDLVWRIRALAPKPGAVSSLEAEPLRILAAHAIEEPCGVRPGTISLPGPGILRVATGEGWLEVERLQRAGGKAMDVDAFLRGRSVAEGVRLGEVNSGDD